MNSHIMPTYNRTRFAFTHGQGPWLYDEAGQEYFDFGAGIAVNAFGHAHPRLVAVLQEQAAKLWHVSNLYRVHEQEALADMLCEDSFADQVFFTNSGTEAIECAIKTARKYHSENGAPRDKIIAFHGAFHGRSIGAISAAGSPKMVDGFGAMVPGFVQVAPDDTDAFDAEMGDDVAAILIEPIQGEGGIRVVNDAVLQHLRAAADRHGALLIFDEIQCGMGRTGKMWAHEWAGVRPDIMAVAKGIGGGFPLGACLATQDAAKGMMAGTHGSTYGGNPLACRVGLEVMRMMKEPGFLDDVSALAGELRQRLEGLAAMHPDVFGAVRGQGLMLGLECKRDAAEFVQIAREHHVLTVAAAENVVRLLPPLNMTRKDMEAGVARLESAATALQGA